MADERIVAELVLDDGKYSVRMKNASKEAKAFERDIMRLNQRMIKNDNAMQSASFSLMKWTVIVGQARNALHQLWFVTGQWATSLVKTSAEIERMTVLMKGMSDAADQVGKSAEAASNVNKLFDMAANAPFTINALSDSFVKFKSVGLDPLDGSMGALVDAVAAFGGTDEVMHRASIAIQQMAGKGVISMEELRQQLGEAVPEAITIMARTMGVSYGELVEEISKGTVAAKPALDAMFNGMKMVYGGRAQSMMDTYNGRVAKLRTTWTQLVSQNDGIKNYFESQKNLITTLTKLLGSNAIEGFATTIGNALANMTERTATAIGGIAVFVGKFMGMVRTLNSSAMDKTTFIGSVWEGLKGIIELAGKANAALMQIYKGLSMAALGLTEEEFEERTLANRVRAGADFAEEEFDDLQNLLETSGEDLKASRADLEKNYTALELALNNSAKNGGRAGEKFQSVEELEIAAAQYERASQNFNRLQEEFRRKQEAYNKAAKEYQVFKNAAPGSAGQGEARLAMRQAELDLDEILPKLKEARSNFLSVQNAMETAVAATGGSISEVMSSFGEKYDEFGNKIRVSQDDLEKLAASSDKTVAAAAANVLDVQKKIEDLSGLRVDLSDIIDVEFGEKVEGVLDDAMSVIEDFQAEQNSTAVAMMESVDEVMQSTTGSQNERYAQATEIVNAYYDQQVTSLNEILAAAQAGMIAQGEAGAAAAVQLGEVVAGILASLGQVQSTYLGSLKGGITTVASSGGGSKKKGKSPAQRAGERLEDMVKEANLAADKVAERFANPFAYELPSAIDSARKKIDKLAEDMSGGKWTGQMQSLFNTIATNEMTEEMIKMAEASRDIRRNLMGEKQRRTEIYDEEVKRIKEMKAKLIEMGIWRVEWEGTVQEQLLALQEEYDSKSPMGEFMNEWKDLYENIEEVGTDTMRSLSQSMADMVTEGKADFEDLARSAVNSLLQVSFNAALSGITDYAAAGIKSWMGGGASTSASVSHAGSIVGQSGGRNVSVNSNLFSNAQRYHTGGVIGQEVPAILEKGEGVFTAAQMKAIGAGMSGPREAKVNIINNTGTEVESEETMARFSPDGMILDVVLKRVQQPGPFRDSMKRALK